MFAASIVTLLSLPLLQLNNGGAPARPDTRAAAAVVGVAAAESPAADTAGGTVPASLAPVTLAAAAQVALDPTVAPTTAAPAAAATVPATNAKAAPTTARPTTTTARPTATTVRPAPTTTARPAAPATTAAPVPEQAEVPDEAPSPASTAAPDTTVLTREYQEGWATWHPYDNTDPRWGARPCAHRTLPKGTIVTITYLKTGASTTCEVRDRGPYGPGGVIDLDPEIFSELTHTDVGKIKVRITW